LAESYTIQTFPLPLCPKPMPHVEIYTDSTADLPKDLARRYGIHVIPLVTRIKEDQFFDGETIDPDTIIKHMHDGVIPKTSAPSPGLIQKRFEEADGDPIVSVHISSGLSGTYQSALLAGEKIHPTPRSVDSLNTSMALGFLALEGAKLKSGGKSAQEIYETLEEIKKRLVSVFILKDVNWVYEGGRIGKATKIAADTFKIKPLMMMYEGKAVDVEHIRTWGNAKSRLATLLQSMKFADLAIMYGENRTEADDFASDIPLPTSGDILRAQMGSTILAYSGPVIVAGCGILVPGSTPMTPEMLRAM
jgi:DegV family protein with EDD domain